MASDEEVVHSFELSVPAPEAFEIDDVRGGPMPVGVKLEMPDDQKGTFLVLASLRPSDLESLSRSFDGVTPSLDREGLISQITESEDLSSIPRLVEITQVLLNLAGTIQDAEVDAASAIDAVFEGIAEDDVVDLDVSTLPQVKKLLAEIIDKPALATISAGLSALTSRQRILLSASFESDLRPLFIGPGSEEQVGGFVVSHELILRTRNSNKSEILYLTIDSEDLDHLSMMITKAKKRDLFLREFARESRVAVLNKGIGGLIDVPSK